MKIALISGSRSDRNALVMVEKALKESGHETRLDDIDVGCMGASPVEAAKYAVVMTSFVLGARRPDMVIVHGDRYEVLAATMMANLMGYSIAHSGGGDVTEGSQDDSFRHAITKLSHLHFPSNQDSADRIVQMGEEPDRVHVTGCPGIDMVMATPTMTRAGIFVTIGLANDYMLTVPQRSLLVLFHSNTLGDTASELEALSVALARRTEALVLLGPNADAGGDLIRREWQRLAQNRPDTVYHDNVEPQVFYSLLRWCDVLVGNSSAGFYEAPCFGTPVVNLGDRQKGRPLGGVASQCGNSTDPAYIGEHIEAMIGKRFGSREYGGTSNPYGDGHAAERIAKVIGGIEDPRALLRKKFHQWCLSGSVEPLRDEFKRTMDAIAQGIIL